ncbi:MAG: YncE family protein [Chitinophagaceae bacterium]|nr:YncE family protein [Chitinophagaceae bacterium]
MKFILICIVTINCLTSCKGQDNFGTDYLHLDKVIELPGVSGRIDHMAVNLKNHLLYVAALGNNSVEVVDLLKGKLIHSIKGLDEPQGIAYIPERNEIVIANGGDGSCIFYDATSYSIISTLHLGGDADNVRYNASNGKIYVGYGNGGIAVIDAGTHQKIADIKLPAHPESFQLDLKNNLLAVNIPDDNIISVINLNKLKVVRSWKTNSLRANFPMALDTSANHLLVGYRHPAVFVTYDIKTGAEISHNDLVSDVDDLFYNEQKQEVIASGGGGSINIFKKESNAFKQIANISTRAGARTSLFIPSTQAFILAKRSQMGRSAAIAVYQFRDH